MKNNNKKTISAKKFVKIAYKKYSVALNKLANE
jgi:hypothetical protein